jgi:20S proteasome alpha/beta subunit
MTVILGLRKKIKNKVHCVYAADSLIVDGEDKVVLKNNHKYVVFDNFVALFSGDASVQHVLDNIKTTKNKKLAKSMKMRSLQDVQKFVQSVTKAHRKQLKSVGVNVDNASDIDFELLIVTRTHIYGPDPDGFITISDDYLSGGCGRVISNAILRNGYDKATTLSELKQLAFDAIETVCESNTQCGGDVIVREFK